MGFMTAEERNDLSLAKNAKMVRLGVYDVGIVIASVLLAGHADRFTKFWPWPEYPLEVVTLLCVIGLWLGIIIKRQADWRSVDRLEKALARDEVERETGRRLNKAELKNLGLE